MSLHKKLDLIWGASSIAKELGILPRQAFYMLENGLIPSRKVGAKWVVARSALAEFFGGEDVAYSAEGIGLEHSPLTPKQEAFAKAFVETGNASEAYRRVYLLPSTRRRRNIGGSASLVRNNPKVRARIDELQMEALNGRNPTDTG